MRKVPFAAADLPTAKIDRTLAMLLALGEYVGDICPYCGLPLTPHDISDAVWGLGDKPAHGACFQEFQGQV